MAKLAIFIAVANLACILCQEDEEPCLVEVGFMRPGPNSTYTVTPAVETPEECCLLCRQDPDCESWNRDRRNGACAFKRGVPDLVMDDNFDSGVVGGAVAPDQVPASAPCPVEDGVDFKGGDIADIAQGMGRMTEDPDECCRMCELDLRCFSWTRSKSTGACWLKDRIPSRIESDDFNSGTVI